MDRQTALRKLRACLRLAASSNANEAAGALRQATKLMNDYGLTQADAEDAELGAYAAPTRNSRADLPLHLADLAHAVATHFRCRPLLGRSKTGMVEIRFIGPRTGSEVSAYAFTVLRRQMDADISRHTRRIRKRANRQARATAFGLGWVGAVLVLLDIRALAADERTRIDAYIARSYGPTEDTETRAIDKKRINHGDHYAGYLAGKKAKLSDGLSGASQAQLEHQA